LNVSKLTTQQIKKLAKEKVAAVPAGVRWSSLVKEIHSGFPETPINTIWGSTRALFVDDPDISKISKGIYAIAGQGETLGGVSPATEEQTESKPASEKDFYEPFATWLRDVDEVTEALAIGGNIFKSKWNTPDVIGVLRPRKGDLVKFEPQIVSAEIKIDPAQPIVAFGQAISYRLFSHKCYLVLPSASSDDDLDRITSLSTIFGLGLVTFDLDKQNPAFTLVVRAIVAQPDMVYVNQMAAQLNAYDPKGFDRLF
jgi:hypothetical protein